MRLGMISVVVLLTVSFFGVNCSAYGLGVIESDWMFQVDGKVTKEKIAQHVESALLIAERIALSELTRSVDFSKELSTLDGLAQKLKKTNNNKDVLTQLYFEVRKVKRSIMFKDPLVDFSRVLLIDNPYPGAGRESGHEARHRNGFMAKMGGRLVIIDGLDPDADVTTLAPTLGAQASFWRPDISWDGKKIVFSMRPEGEKSFHLYEINTDGISFKQLTWGDYDDLDPIYSPDGKILFCTTRAHTYVRCMPYTHSFVLARCDADGKNIYVISRNSEPDYLPSILNDGRVIYTRWEYTDKPLWRAQSLWSMNTNGTNVTHFWGNQSTWPDVVIEARAIPNSRKVMFTGVGSAWGQDA